MAPPPHRHLLLLLLLLPLVLLAGTPASADDLVSELQSLRARSPSGVIHLTDTSVTRFLSAPSARRPYSVLVFFDAASLHSKPDLHLPQLRTEFALLSASFLAHNPDSGDLFFADIEFAESQHSFHQFGVNSLPHIRLIRSDHATLSGSEQMDQSHFARLADSMAEFIESRTGLEVGPIVRPPLLSRNQIILLGILFLISIPFMIKRIIDGETLLHDPRVWMAGALFVYFFSVSGGMYGIIRHTPMFLTDRADPNKLVFFYQGSGMQLGAEGFTVGFLYTLVGLMIAVVTHLLVKVESLQTQRLAMLAVMVVGWWAVRKVIYLDNWKTGYSIHTFFPSSWR
ncbi:putative dolichyl-diphosphooligosaccharide--protein glycosyltransferase subunit 3 [Zea mays]|jgi:oligosaccharyltransferase complex subunit gamma|uniref:Oligosaccharide transporter n=2 Tax=Zea mays TaxID=4577 RepID=B4FSV8_MAIZE|nr:Probable dolichyl-diphosphooligosaccharide--protein glycosyltransferase subunit 3 precursor [Zea mays]ACF85201.1 unknown [Zea mays]ACG32455.1 oligosaccharide transporter [Zea mays]ONM05006.1 putative dolichyl-diphosphooligosaccharide--protein glycosyltransferase subunit 3B [Zea mays]PWZ57433.1 putative dolichyl-diphosphooligosaccharide--protein glycosyltransferase subunit 3 [Zea mays]|eukprot:NP_001148670.1 uncharacterized protein LOC100282286 precursor [Zea mays]